MENRAKSFRETQSSITQWADETFGKIQDPKTAIKRLLEEVKEFTDYAEAILELPGPPNALQQIDLVKEIADIIIVSYRLASIWNMDLQLNVDLKMSINRGRRWKKDGTGHGYHIKEEK